MTHRLQQKSKKVHFNEVIENTVIINQVNN